MLKMLSEKKIFFYFSLFILIELLSYLSLFNNVLNLIIFCLLTIVALGVSIYKLEYGLLMVIGELLIGSMGRMFSLSVGNFDLSIRMSFWIIIMLVFFGKLIWSLKQQGKQSNYLKSLYNFYFKYYVLIIGVFFLLGIINALILGNNRNLIFNDANGWLYYLLILPTIIVYTSKTRDELKNLSVLFIAATFWLSLKTFLLLYVFTHNLSFSSEIYFWLRKTLVGEMTATLSGWPRIFIQGQIFAALGLFFAFWKNVADKTIDWKKILLNIFIAALFAGVLLISFSRSFWLALSITIVLLLTMAWLFFSFKKMLLSIAWLVAVFLISFALLYLTSVFPYPRSGSFNADFAGRVDISNTEEAAISSRWSLLPVLADEIKKSPIFGQGYGKTVTYISNDPRVLEQDSSGSYTTYAFEWGYLDIWLKIGLLGLSAYLAFIFSVLKNAWQITKKNKDELILGLIGGIVFIVITNFFTPYLNHPLGIGVVIIGTCLISKYRVY